MPRTVNFFLSVARLRLGFGPSKGLGLGLVESRVKKNKDLKNFSERRNPTNGNNVGIVDYYRRIDGV